MPDVRGPVLADSCPMHNALQNEIIRANADQAARRSTTGRFRRRPQPRFARIRRSLARSPRGA